ncbi:polysaccharide pyruvyl transferase family protein [Microbulbifer hainanensis]|uniref:polysaccharide pyruvyl transferase family protein n=1 Tax=Microbulbifer hainanensis TaxID=2735675 RepID=UPI001866AAFA|nr:polysaccharide pyruvyl transferase family protein [Microbulbifer hainanensis]
MYQIMGLGSGNNKIVNKYSEFTDAASANSGNLLFNYALMKIVDGGHNRINWSTHFSKVNEDGRTLLLPMANNIGGHMDLSKNGPRIQNVSVHKVVFGLGAQFSLGEQLETAAQRVPEGTNQWLSAITKNVEHPNISVRGAITKSYFEFIGMGKNTVILGCPSHLINPDPDLGKSLQSKVNQLSQASLKAGIGITAGNPLVKNLHRLERFLIDLINKYGGNYIVQAPKSLICIAEGWHSELSETEISEIRDCWYPDYSIAEMYNWFRQFSRTYVSIPQWARDVSKHELVVGTRIHGCQIALQSGVPAVCLYIDSRTKELCDTMKIPSMDAREFQKNPKEEVLLKLLKSWDWNNYDKTRINLTKGTISFLKQNGIKPSAHLLKLSSPNKS